MTDWSEWGTWEGEGLRREVFYFSSAGIDLYGSLFASAELTRPCGWVACASWGVEADRCDPLLRSVGLEMARLGGAAMVFHYPGYGDSHGEPRDLSLPDLATAAIDALAEARRRRPSVEWSLAGYMLGASIAALAAREASIDRLLLVQPALRPGAYFQRLIRRAERLPVGSRPSGEKMSLGNGDGMAYGYPLPAPILAHPAAADATVADAVSRYEGEGAVIRHAAPADPDPDAVPERFERIEVAGTWRFGSLNNPRLAKAASEWLARSTGTVAA